MGRARSLYPWASHAFTRLHAGRAALPYKPEVMTPPVSSAGSIPGSIWARYGALRHETHNPGNGSTEPKSGAEEHRVTR